MTIPSACVCGRVVGSGPTIARIAPFILLVIDSTAIDWSSIDVVEWLISDAWQTELGCQQFSLFVF